MLLLNGMNLLSVTLFNRVSKEKRDLRNSFLVGINIFCRSFQSCGVVCHLSLNIRQDMVLPLLSISSSGHNMVIHPAVCMYAAPRPRPLGTVWSEDIFLYKFVFRILKLRGCRCYLTDLVYPEMIYKQPHNWVIFDRPGWGCPSNSPIKEWSS